MHSREKGPGEVYYTVKEVMVHRTDEHRDTVEAERSSSQQQITREPSKTGAEGKSRKQKKDNQPEEEMHGAEVTGTEREIKETVEEMSPAVVDVQMTNKSKDELWEEYASLQEELAVVQRTQFRTERDRALTSWETSKRILEKIKARMREKLKLKQEAEKRRQAEIQEHQQKVTQLENAHHSEICELKMATSAATSKTSEEHVGSEIKLQKKLHLSRADKREIESHTQIYLIKLQQKQQHEFLDLNYSYKKQARELEARYESKIRDLFTMAKTNIQTELIAIDKRMKICTANTIEQQEAAWRGPQKYINDDIGASLARKRLERKLEDLKERHKRLDRSVVAASRRNKRLRQSLKELRQKLTKSNKDLTDEIKAAAKRRKQANRVTVQMLGERRELYMKNQQLELDHAQAQQEYNELQMKQTEAVLGLQQRGDLKALVLEKKIEAMRETLEKQKLRLWVALAFGQGDQKAGKNITELFESKHTTIQALEDDISGALMEHGNLVKKAAALNIPVHKQLSSGDFKKSTRKASEDSKKFEDLMQELTALHISVQKDAL